jgi:Fe-S oxidoreductase
MPQWIREGKLKVSSDWNKDLKIKFTVQDPCQIVRKSFGDPVAEDLRFVVKSVVGEENFIDMQPNRSNNFCCGGGGGFLQSGFKEQRLAVRQAQGPTDQGHRGRLLHRRPATTATPRSTN